MNQTLGLSGDLPRAFIAIAAVLAIVGIVLLLVELVRQEGAERRWLVALTGILASALCLFALLRPVVITSRGSRVGPKVMVLVDRSRSLLLPGDDGKPRWEKADQAVAGLKNGRKDVRFGFFGFGEGRPVPLDGAPVRLVLPLEGGPAAPAAEVLPPAPAPAVARRVLVVDDEPEIVDLVRAMLEGAGYEVASAESGAVPVEMLEEVGFDAIVSDLRMPDMDGAALWREVKARRPELAQRMLFVTGDTLSPAPERFVQEPGCPSLDKPFPKADLLARVKALL